MKFYFSLLLALSVTLGVIAQKKELKNTQKLVDASMFQQALSSLETIKPLVENAEPKYTSHYYYLLGISNQGTKSFIAAIEAFDKVKSVEKEANLKKYTALVDANATQLTNDLINSAVDLNGNDKFIEAAQLLHLAYTLDKDNNVDYLYYAASSAVNGGDYENALTYYILLKELNYTGVSKKYYVTEVITGEETEVDETTYNLYQKSKDYTNLRQEDTPSRLPEIVKNIALIHVNQGNNDAAMAAVQDARELAPKDVGLILTEADLYIKLGDQARFANLMQEAIAQDPNNAILYYNLGVVNGNEGNRSKAIEYYEKAIQLDPSYEASYLNIASVILEGESAIVEQMNSLGTSAADNRKYDQLKAKRENLFLEAVPYLEKLVSINPKNPEALTTLKNIFGTIGDTANFKKYRDILDSL